MNRPRLCTEKKCKPVWNMIDEEYIGKGGSGDCVGTLEKPVTFVYDGVEHTNNMCHCTYSPLKGMIRYQINYDDCILITKLIIKLMDKEKPQLCDECGFVSRWFGVVITQLDKSKLCGKCAVRLGKDVWDEEHKRYWYN